MLATLASVSSHTTHQAPATRQVRNPKDIAKDVKSVEMVIERHAEKPLSDASIIAQRRLDALHEELVSAILADRPALAERARYRARVAETAHQAFLEGSISLGLRNRHATAAADARAEVLALAQGCLKAAKAGYMSCGGVKELHRIA